MVRHLLRGVPKVFGLQFICLAKDRVVRLGQPIVCPIVLPDVECSDVDQSKRWVRAIVCFGQNVVIFQSLRLFLQHANWFIEMHGYRKLSNVLSNEVFQHLEDRGFLVWRLKPGKLVSLPVIRNVIVLVGISLSLSLYLVG